MFSGMCSRKYDIRLCFEYILEDVLLVNRAKITAGPPGFAPLCSCECRIIVMCSVNVKRQVWRAFQNEGGGDKVSRTADMGRS